MFEGQAEEAMNYHKDTFADTRIVQLTRYGAELGEMEGKVARGGFVQGFRQNTSYEIERHKNTHSLRCRRSGYT